MKKFLSKLVCFSALFIIALSPLTAKADSISGGISIAGMDTFTGSSINFNPSTGSILNSTLPGVLPFGPAQLGSITDFSKASGIVLFSAFSGLNKLTFTLNGPVSVVSYSSSFLNITGNGTFAISGSSYTPTTGTFNLTSTSNTMTSFTIDSGVAVTPEPSSLLMLGSGLVSTAGMLMRRRRAMLA